MCSRSTACRKVALHCNVLNRVATHCANLATRCHCVTTDTFVGAFHNLLSARPSPLLVVDAGANIGFFSLYAAAMRHRVLAYEPAATNVELLRQSKIANGFGDSLRVREVALGKLVGTAGLYVSAFNKGNAQLDSTENDRRRDRNVKRPCRAARNCGVCRTAQTVTRVARCDVASGR